VRVLVRRTRGACCVRDDGVSASRYAQRASKAGAASSARVTIAREEREPGALRAYSSARNALMMLPRGKMSVLRCYA